MIEGVATASAVNQNNPQAVQAQVETPVETTPDVAQGKVNPVEDVEDLSNRSASNEHPGEQSAAKEDTGEGQIIDFLG